MPKPIYYEGQIFDPPDDTQPALVYRGGKFFPVDEDPGVKAAAGGGGGLNDVEQKELGAARTSAQNARMAREKADQFMALNRQVGTGGLMAIPGVSELAGVFNPKVASMQGLSNAMIPGMHVTPGPMTDADAKLYKSAIPNPNLGGKTNATLTNSIAKQEQQLAARAAFYERFAERTGSLNGAPAAFNKWWSEYSGKGAAAPRLPSAGPGNLPQKGGFKYLGSE